MIDGDGDGNIIIALQQHITPTLTSPPCSGGAACALPPKTHDDGNELVVKGNDLFLIPMQLAWSLGMMGKQRAFK